MLRVNGKNINFNGESFAEINGVNTLMMRINSNYYGSDLRIDFNILNPTYYEDNKESILNDIEDFLDKAIDTAVLTSTEETSVIEEENIDEEIPLEEEE